MSKPKIRFAAMATMLLCLQLTACGNLTQENYDQIKMGMSFQEVEKLLGSGATCDSAMGMKSCTWGDKDKYVKIQFMADKVVIHAAKGLR